MQQTDLPNFTLALPGLPAKVGGTEIWTDGGTPCNIPRLGYGIGYGSFRIGAGEIVRVSFGQPMSANAAEIRTMCSALLETPPELRQLTFYSDSTIALKWLKDAPRGRLKPGKKMSPEMSEAIRLLRAVAVGREITARWVPRAFIFAIFGH